MTDIPEEAVCDLDATIFDYHLVGTPGLSDDCSDVLKRLELGRLHGVTIPEGARVALVTGASCRDPREYDDPHRFDIDRVPNRQVYFGYGAHVCIGKSLARQETRVALEEVARRFPDYEIDESGLTRTYQAHVRGFASVPMSI